MGAGVRDPLLGGEVGRYRVERLIAEGGMGRVYEGVDDLLGHRVAIKVLAPRYANDRELAVRMAAEARVVNLIASRHVPRTLEFGVLDDGRPAIVMELVTGNRLRDLISVGRAPLGGIVDVVLQVLDAIGAAHAVGIVHRDLKPENILVANDGHVHVVDFGLAKLAQPGELALSRTRSSIVMGTPHYMAPERIVAGDADERADLYALGVVLFEAAAGCRPFEGTSDFEVMRAQVDGPIPSLCAARSDVPRQLDAIVEIALAKQPRDRFASAAAMANALRSAAQALPRDEWRSLASIGARPLPLALPVELAVANDPPTRDDDVPTMVARRRSGWMAPAITALATGAPAFGFVGAR